MRPPGPAPARAEAATSSPACDHANDAGVIPAPPGAPTGYSAAAMDHGAEPSMEAHLYVAPRGRDCGRQHVAVERCPPDALAIESDADGVQAGVLASPGDDVGALGVVADRRMRCVVLWAGDGDVKHVATAFARDAAAVDGLDGERRRLTGDSVRHAAAKASAVLREGLVSEDLDPHRAATNGHAVDDRVNAVQPRNLWREARLIHALRHAMPVSQSSWGSGIFADTSVFDTQACPQLEGQHGARGAMWWAMQWFQSASCSFSAN